MAAAPTFAQRCSRLWRHWRTRPWDAHRAFPPATLAAIEAAIGDGEKTHRAQLRLIVEVALGLGAVWRGVSNRERALALFAQYGIWDTEENCGVLIYVNLAERQVDIVTDRHIGRKVDAATWDAVCLSMTAGYARGQFHDSSLAAVARVNALLHQHFPADGARNNELPDQPIML
jgi:uncharacterized membrane protein